MRPEWEAWAPALDRTLRTRIAGLQGSLELTPVRGGRSNPTFFVSYGNRRLVLRKQPPGQLLASAHAIDREYRILEALGPTDVPVPRPLFYETDPGIVGTPFYVMERVEGRVFDDPALPGLPPAERNAMILASAQTLAKMHRLDWRTIGLGDFGRPGHFYVRQISRWTRQWEQSRTRPIPDIDTLAAWLADNVPPSEASAIVHGDFRLSNLMFHPSEPRIVAVLDWELCTIGQPLADVAYFGLMWRLSPSEHMGVRGLDASEWGIPTHAEWLRCYRSAVGAAEAPTPFHTAFALFRLAVIAEGVADRARQGIGHGSDAADFGRLSAVFAQRGLAAVGNGASHGSA